jgi:hypothetical protein
MIISNQEVLAEIRRLEKLKGETGNKRTRFRRRGNKKGS